MRCRSRLYKAPALIALTLVLILTFAYIQECHAETIDSTFYLNHSYIIESGDMLKIMVWGHENLSGTVIVGEDGRISWIGLPEDVYVLGKSIPEIQAKLTGELEYYLKDPKIIVTLIEAKTIRITIVGAVRSPGVYPFRTKPTLMGALASAGGHTSEADLTCIRITRFLAQPTNGTESKSVIVDASKALAGEEKIEDLGLYSFFEDGDVIYVPEKSRTVSVLGEIQKPGLYTLDTSGPGTRIFDIIASAGGPNSNADTGSIRVTRYTKQEIQTIEIDLDISTEMGPESVGSPQNCDGSFVLIPGDVVYVPRLITVQVLGEVPSPGKYQLKPGSSITQAISRAGGTLNSADTSCISLHRSKAEGAKIFNFDLNSALTGEIPHEALTLQNQDTIIVPELVHQVSVLGAVNRPGIYRIYETSRVLEIVTLAGWVTHDSDSGSAILIRKLGEGKIQQFPINLKRLQSGADEKENYLLNDGDIIYVPKAITITVLGQVRIPGTYTLKSGSNIMDALFKAGGTLPDSNQTEVLLIRGDNDPKSQEIDINKIMADSNATDFNLFEGDIIFVPEIIREVSVLGEIARPGIYKIKDNTTLFEVIAQAGGIKETGNPTTIRLTRSSPDGEYITRRINLEEIDEKISLETWILNNGDAIYVPRL